MPFRFETIVTLQHRKSASYFKICLVSNFPPALGLGPGLCASLVSMPINVIRMKGVRRMRPAVPDTESMVVRGLKRKVTILQTKNE